MSFADEEFRNVLARATEIEQAEALDQSDVETLLAAADEVGISRTAVERALRERSALPMKPPSTGQLVFARSSDDKYYVAEVRAASQEGFTVRFLRGSEHLVQLEDLKPCSFLPGERVVVDWPWWGTWTCFVMTYDVAGRRVTLSDGWGDSHQFPISDVWLAPRKVGNSRKARVVTALAVAAGTGAAVGSLLTLWLA